MTSSTRATSPSPVKSYHCSRSRWAGSTWPLWTHRARVGSSPNGPAEAVITFSTASTSPRGLVPGCAHFSTSNSERVTAVCTVRSVSAGSTVTSSGNSSMNNPTVALSAGVRRWCTGTAMRRRRRPDSRCSVTARVVASTASTPRSGLRARSSPASARCRAWRRSASNGTATRSLRVVSGPLRYSSAGAEASRGVAQWAAALRHNSLCAAASTSSRWSWKAGSATGWPA
ncbi:MAG: hypothetical protein R2755_17680 [Acidimicrobiales bacterium]